MGGLQFGSICDPSIVKLNSAFPFCTGKSPLASKASLFAAFGCFAPGLMQDTVPDTSTKMVSTLPSPATFPETVSVSSLRVAVGDPTKCALLTANAAVAESARTVRIIRTTRDDLRTNVIDASLRRPRGSDVDEHSG